MLPLWVTIIYSVNSALIPVDPAYVLRNSSATWFEVPDGWVGMRIHLEGADAVCFVDDEPERLCFVASIGERWAIELDVRRGGRLAIFSCGNPQRRVILYHDVIFGKPLLAPDTVYINRGCLFDLFGVLGR